MTNPVLRIQITGDQAGIRLDQALSDVLPDRSRSQIQQWIRDGRVRIDNAVPRQRDKLAGNELVEIEVPESVEERWQPEAIPLNIVFEDESILVIDKPAGLVVHPGAGNPRGTLLNALLSHAPSLQRLPRAGIVHRIDKDTSGLLVVAKTERARLNLIDQLQAHTLEREYLAVVCGMMVAGGTVDEPVGRHPHDRTRMAVTVKGKPAVTHYRVKEKYRAHVLITVNLETGRTHQIRVHMTHIHHPLVGDPVYGGRLRLPSDCSDSLKQALRCFKRQALHARRLGLIHPESGAARHWQSPVPEDLAGLIETLRQDKRASRND
ncbi:MAG: 23S rRNA pseudouridine(1911/1915/1917) synthase RluD [Gammaproteobacteria bacterium]|nr:MAG: 23S rRNA pseudouridine(1911/1915/1917) synthase RluD [Gammaproteobacteria bacterium]